MVLKGDVKSIRHSKHRDPTVGILIELSDILTNGNRQMRCKQRDCYEQDLCAQRTLHHL